MPESADYKVIRRRFERLWLRCAAHDGSGVFAELLSRYGEPVRQYHTPEHIEHCLGQLDVSRQLIEQPDAVEMALWFHDAVYIPGAADNECRSATLFLELSEGMCRASFRDRVRDLIVVTDHAQSVNHGDEGFMVDIDLSSFGLPWNRFWRDSQAVRREFSHLSDVEFMRAHRSFLNALLDRDYFFCTAFFRERYEARARANIHRLLNGDLVAPLH